MSTKNQTSKQHSSTRKAATAKAGKRAGSLSPEAQLQRAQLSKFRQLSVLQEQAIAFDEVELAYREHGVYEAKGVARRYNISFTETEMLIVSAKERFSNHVDKLVQLITKRRDRGDNLTFGEVAHAVTYREFMQAQVNYKEGK